MEELKATTQEEADITKDESLKFTPTKKELHGEKIVFFLSSSSSRLKKNNPAIITLSEFRKFTKRVGFINFRSCRKFNKITVSLLWVYSLIC